MQTPRDAQATDLDATAETRRAPSQEGRARFYPFVTMEEGPVQPSAPRNTSPAIESRIGHYDAEIFGFLVGALDDACLARNVFRSVVERTTVELEAFDGRCPLRVWTYAIAWRTIGDVRRERGLERIDCSPVTPASRLTKRSTVRPCATSREAVTLLRSSLEIDDRALLILRLDRSFDWRDLAFIWLGAASSAAEVAEESERLATQFALLRRRLTHAALGDSLSPPRE